MEMSMAVDLEALGAAIAEMNVAWTAAFQGGDAAALAALYTDDAARMAPNEETVRGRAVIEQIFTEMFATTSARTIDINTTDYGAGGNVAYAIGTYSFSYEMEGATKTDEGKFLTVSELTDDGWRITAHSWSSNLPLE
jgi:uncharacterized protein (TIGR02246 family)